MRKKIRINGKTSNVLYQFKVFHFAPDMKIDDKGYLVEQDGKHFIVLTDYGVKYVATEKELKKKIKMYKEALDETQYALDQLITEKYFEQ